MNIRVAGEPMQKRHSVLYRFMGSGKTPSIAGSKIAVQYRVNHAVRGQYQRHLQAENKK